MVREIFGQMKNSTSHQSPSMKFRGQRVALAIVENLHVVEDRKAGLVMIFEDDMMH